MHCSNLESMADPLEDANAGVGSALGRPSWNSAPELSLTTVPSCSRGPNVIHLSQQQPTRKSPGYHKWWPLPNQFCILKTQVTSPREVDKAYSWAADVSARKMAAVDPTAVASEDDTSKKDATRMSKVTADSGKSWIA